ncbi:MAG: TlpA family protein disulfide reductase [Gammaproteobacteria bacterium]|nr:TlpA family protein disulfide reductase [Gammaproteobacteria bacterium]
MIAAIKSRPLLSTFALLFSFPLTGSAAGVGDTGPDWTLHAPSGQQINFYADSKDKVSVILFWATWCPYCRTLMPHIQTVADEFKDQPVRFYALDVWEDSDPVAHMKKHGFTFTLLLNAEPAADAWGVLGTPGLFVVDESHTIRYQRVSGEDDLDVEIALRETIAAALAQ